MIRIVLIYILVISTITSYTPLLLFSNFTVIHAVQVFAALLLLINSFSIIRHNKLFKLFVFYTIFHFVTYGLRGENASFREFIMWEIPPLLYMSITSRDATKFKPLFYFLLALFLTNVGVSIIERINMSPMFPANEAFMEDIKEGMANGDVTTFRATALFGHPLTNANIAAIMAICLYYCQFLTVKKRQICLFLCLISLLLFGARGALYIFILIVLILLYKNLTTQSRKNRRYFYIAFLLSIILIYKYSGFLASRILSQDVSSDGVMARVWTIQSFMNLSFTELLFGGNKLLYEENGYLMTIAEAGLILGLGTILCQILFSWKIICNMKKSDKMLVLLSFVGIGSTNSNLHGYWIINMYFIYVIFCILCFQNYNLQNKKI